VFGDCANNSKQKKMAIGLVQFYQRLMFSLLLAAVAVVTMAGAEQAAIVNLPLKA
jgi:hypothetical protein